MSDLNDPLTPVEIVLGRKRKIVVVIAVLVLAAIVYWLVFVNQYVVAFRNQEDHFLYGSIGSEASTGPPYWVFKALPVMYADKLGPAGWGHFGMLYEKPGDDLPIGVSRRIVSGVDRVWLNCSVCHVGTYTLPNQTERHLVYGAPSNNLRLQEFILFFIDLGSDPGFTADRLIAAINSPEVGGHLNAFEQVVYRYVIFPRLQAAFADLGKRLTFVARQEKWGPGRVDTFNPYKSLQFNFPMDAASISDAALNGSSDYPSIWQQRPREGMNLHWDGNNNSVAERNLSAALGAGVTPVTVDRSSIRRIEQWMWDLPAPQFPAKVDVDAAERGREVFSDTCAGCHGMKTGGTYSYNTDHFKRLGRTVALADIGTDRGRWASYTPDFAAAQNQLYAGYPWRFKRFHKTNGYANHPLDGIWARSPYLHNGSIPTLRDLLEPSSQRPARWYRGSEVLDLARVGYRSDDAAPGDQLFLYDTSKTGNSNRGHEGKAYGTELSGADKDALVEYMKTL
ncbi:MULTISPECIES: cytochrome c [unclassified Rhizobium]|jgi:hypothetical protein|uniref:c-type cytochrome n=1 Tax=unclassified Rhizobium TaxID=2613769 RepID=UPI001AEACCD2|nr:MULTISPECIES: cytochrome c [unclassified Rhizobium]MBP2459348.1 cytochrome c553 [Rhizobium sp. PvP014]MBP2531643.1 cytochrome c553 [Rhizobium sp. PvP099]